MAKIALHMEATKIEPEKTASEIQSFLTRYKINGFHYFYENGEISGVCFSININGQSFTYKVPAKWEPLIQLARDKKTKYLRPGNIAQAKRVAWRQVLMWIKSQMTLIETGMVKLEEVFLPYMLADNNTTVFELFQNNQMALPSGEQR